MHVPRDSGTPLSFGWHQRGEYKSSHRFVSYLLREVMCSSDRPPSSSLMMNSLSFSSPGCTGKLLRKISRRTVKQQVRKKVNTINRTWKLFSWHIVFTSCDEMTQKLWEGPLLNYFPSMLWGNAQICIWVKADVTFFSLVLQKMPLHNLSAKRRIH